ncbi:MAG: LacI family DNA-binding transcriptional regulator [Verrucomicrobiota bacterium]
MPQRITIKDIAQETGLGIATVSRALQGLPIVKEATRKRVHDAAQRLNYRPDAFARGLRARRESNSQNAFKAVLGFLNIHADRHEMYTSARIRDYLKGAQKRADEWGYKLEEIWSFQPGVSGKRLSEILLARGIHGVLLYGVPHITKDVQGWPLDWKQFSCVHVGGILPELGFSYVQSDPFDRLSEIMDRLFKLGHRRIGVIYSHELDALRYRSRHASAYRFHIQNVPKADQLPIFEQQALRQLQCNRFSITPQLSRWINRWKPSVLVGENVRRLIEALTDAGYSIPQDLSVVHLLGAGDTISGISENSRAIGYHATQLLIDAIVRNERGKPLHPVGLNIQSHWVEGATLKRLK